MSIKSKVFQITGKGSTTKITIILSGTALKCPVSVGKDMGTTTIATINQQASTRGDTE